MKLMTASKLTRRRARFVRFFLERLEPRLAPAAGFLDPTFSDDGRLAMDLNPVDQGISPPPVMAIQHDGKVVLAGSVSSGNVGGMEVLRVNTDGTIDSNFSPAATDAFYDGGDGMGWFGNGLTTPRDMAVQQDGMILIVCDFGVVRLTSDGRLDPSFGTNGVVDTFVGAGGLLPNTSSHFYAMAIQEDGKIVLGGTLSTGSTLATDFYVARLNTDGSRDTTFGLNGVAIVDLGGADTANCLTLQEDGKIVIAGATRESINGSRNMFAAARLTITGSLDESFSGDGKYSYDYSAASNQEIVNAVAVQADGSIILAGSENLSGQDMAVAKLTSLGEQDLNFATNGFAVLELGTAPSIAYSVVIDDLDRIVLGGWAFFANDDAFAIARLDANGALDQSFDGDGSKITLMGEPSSGTNNTVNRDIALRDDGSIIMSGRAYVASPFEGSRSPDGPTPYVTNNIAIQVVLLTVAQKRPFPKTE